METIEEQPTPARQSFKKSGSEILVEMLDRKRRVQAYFRSGDESKKPADVTFVTPFDVPTHKD